MQLNSIVSRTLPALLLFVLFSSSGCEVSQKETGSGRKPETNSRANEPASSVDGPGVNSDAAAPASSTPANQTGASPLVAAREKRLERLRRAAADQTEPKLDIENILKQSKRPAPENSEFSVALTNILVERRTFLDHPVLAKAEKVTEGTKKTLYVFTKTGNSVEVSGDRIEALATASSVEILNAAGIELPDPADVIRTKRKAGKN